MFPEEMSDNGFFIFRKMENEIEIWKDVVGYEGLYEVSSWGRVRSLDKNVWNGKVFFKKKGEFKAFYLHKGYPVTCLYKNNVKKNVNIYRLVAIAFIPNPQNKPEVNHIDGVKTNSHVSNLEWATSSENSYHAYHTGLATAPVLKGSKHGMTNLTEDDVIEIRRLYSENVKRKEIMEMYGIAASPFHRIVSRKSWRHI